MLRVTLRQLAWSCGAAPHLWTTRPVGWRVVGPRSDTSIDSILPATKTFISGDFDHMIRWLSRVSLFAHELGVKPRFVWLCYECVVTLPQDDKSEVVASFMNDAEIEEFNLMNATEDTGKSAFVFDKDFLQQVSKTSMERFMWGPWRESSMGLKYSRSTFDRWYHRASYLVARKSRERQEYKKDTSMETAVLQGGKERKRRMMRRKVSDRRELPPEEKQKEGMWEMAFGDVLPRDVREQLSQSRRSTDVAKWGQSSLSAYGRKM